MDKHSDINSPEYWDKRFQKDWASNGGEQYTHAYGELLAQYLPSHFFQEMQKAAMTFCDWGCAEGEAVAYLNQLYPELKLTGVDVSATAIENAQRKFPDLPFAAENWLAEEFSLPRYDVVFTSHVLEHFSNPITIIQQTLAQVAEKMIIILVPYAEDPARKDPEHFFRFLDSNLPVRWPGWTCVHFQVLDTSMREGLCWRGQQMLLVYAADDWALETGITQFLSSFRGETDVVLAELAKYRQESEKAINELKQTIQENKLSLKLREKQLETQFLHDQNFIRINDVLRSQVETLKAKLKEKQTLYQGLTETHKNLKKTHDQLCAEKQILQTKLASSQAESTQLSSRNEQLRQDLMRTEQAWLKTKDILHSPWKIAFYYLRAVGRRLGLVSKGGETAATSTPMSTPSAEEKPAAGTSPEKTATVVGPDPVVIPVSEPQPSLVHPAARRLRRTDQALKELKIASILDTFSHSCFAPEASFFPVTPDDWKEVFEREEIDFLFVESAWNGNDGAWQYRIASYANPAGKELDDLLQWCNEHDIPTVFWNKEDPPNFDRFIQTAVKFDYIFTTDENCVPAYKERCGHDRVYPLLFAAQPAIHNPISQKRREEKVCFAGTYYADCFPERRRQMDAILAGSVPYGLEIYDRMHGHQGDDRERYLFPEQFQPYIKGKLSYEEMLEAYKAYKVFLNVNSVQDSPTMFARRVFELLACGTPVISTPSKGVTRVFGDLVPQASSAPEVRRYLEPLLEDHAYWYRRAALGVRSVMEKHCYEHRLKEITSKLNLAPPSSGPELFLILDVGCGFPELIIREILSQRFLPAGVFIRKSGEHMKARQVALERWLDKTGCEPEEASISACSQEEAHAKIITALTAKDIAVEPYNGSSTIAKLQKDHGEALFALWDGKSFYGPNYLLDAVQAMGYSGASLSAMSDCFRLNEDGKFCEAQNFTDSVHRSACKGPVACPLKSSFSEHILAATLIGKMEELFEFPVSRINAHEPIGLSVDCYSRHAFEFLHSPNHPEPLSDEISAQVFI